MKQIYFIFLFAIALNSIVKSQANYTIMNQYVNDMVYDSLISKVLISIPSKDYIHGNSIGYIDPISASLSNYYFIGSEPRPLALTDNLKYVYIGIDGSKSVKKFNLATNTNELTFTVGFNNFDGQFYAGNISCKPGTDSVVAVARRAQGNSKGVCIYKNGVKLNDTISYYPTTIDLVHFYSPTVLFGFDNSDTGFDFTTMSVDSQGVKKVNHIGNLMNGFNNDFYINKNMALSDNGDLLDLTGGSATSLAKISIPTTQGFNKVRACFDNGSNLVCFATRGFWNDSLYIFRYNSTTFLKYDQIRVNGFKDEVNKIICWGKSKYIISTLDGKLLIINGILPTVNTKTTEFITSSSVVCGGEIIAEGSSIVISRGVCWSTNANPTIADNNLISGTVTVQFSTTINDLAPNTTYHYRAFATNDAGTAYGEDKEFTTLVALPTLTTTAISGITSNAAISGGNITNDGNATITTRGVCWSTSQSPTVANNKTSDGTGSGQFASNLTGLSPNINYYVRAYAINLAGTAYGDEISFTPLTTGLTQISDKDFSIYPNPTNDKLYINGLTEKAIISIFDQNGKLFFNKQIINDEIDISNFQNGIYIFKVETNKGKITRKFIKE